MGVFFGCFDDAFSAANSKLEGWIEEALERSKTDNGRMSHLDGIRGLALMSVLLFHFGGMLPGGFLGVDMFFVLSGFLMTRALLKQTQSKTFSFQRFVSSRILRICPSLYVTLLGTLVASVYILPKTLLPRVSSVSTAAGFFASNVSFMRESGYHDSSSMSKPLLHTWSLAVEGQFYLLWSCVALLGSVGPMSVFMCLSCSMSVMYHFALSGSDTELFFLLPSRLYEFGAGALALILYNSMSGWLCQALHITAMAMILLSLAFVQGEQGPMILMSLPAVVGTVILISTPGGILNSSRFFSSAVLRYIGSVSYSVYLIHWPAIVLMSFLISDKGTALVASAILTLALSLVMFYSVEENFRMAKCRGKRYDGFWFTAIVLASIVIYGGAIARSADSLIAQVGGTSAKSKGNLVLHTGEWYRDEFVTLEADMRHNRGVILKRKPSQKYVIITGDSFARHLMGAMNKSAHTKGLPNQFLYISRPACLPLIAGRAMIASRVRKDRASFQRTCIDGGKKIEESLNAKEPEKLIIVARWQDYIDDQGAMQKFSEALVKARMKVKHLAVVGITPHPTGSVLNCLWKATAGSQSSADTYESCPKEFVVSEEILMAEKKFKSFVQAKHSGVQYISVLDGKLCRRTSKDAGKVCTAWTHEKGPFYYDEMGHFTMAGSNEALSAAFSYIAT